MTEAMAQLEVLFARRWIAANPREAAALRQAFAETAALPERTRQAMFAELEPAGERLSAAWETAAATRCPLDLADWRQARAAFIAHRAGWSTEWRKEMPMGVPMPITGQAAKEGRRRSRSSRRGDVSERIIDACKSEEPPAHVLTHGISRVENTRREPTVAVSREEFAPGISDQYRVDAFAQAR